MVKNKEPKKSKKQWYKCFRYAVTKVLNYENIKSNRERIIRIKPFTDQLFDQLERNE